MPQGNLFRASSTPEVFRLTLNCPVDDPCGGTTLTSWVHNARCEVVSSGHMTFRGADHDHLETVAVQLIDHFLWGSGASIDSIIGLSKMRIAAANERIRREAEQGGR